MAHSRAAARRRREREQAADRPGASARRTAPTAGQPPPAGTTPFSTSVHAPAGILPRTRHRRCRGRRRGARPSRRTGLRRGREARAGAVHRSAEARCGRRRSRRPRRPGGGLRSSKTARAIAKRRTNGRDGRHSVTATGRPFTRSGRVRNQRRARPPDAASASSCLPRTEGFVRIAGCAARGRLYSLHPSIPCIRPLAHLCHEQIATTCNHARSLTPWLAFPSHAESICDRGPAPHETLRQRHRRRRRQFHCREGRDPGVPRPERRRQDHDDARADRVHAGDGGSRNRRRLRRLRSADRIQAPHRLSARDAAALSRHDGAGVPRVRLEDQGRAREGTRGTRRSGDAAHLHRRHGRTRLRQALEGLPPARGPRAGAHSQSRRADPRRAHRRARPEADQRDPQTDQGARRRSHDRAEHAHPAGGRADLPAGRHHQQGQAWSRSTHRPTSRPACAGRRRCSCRSRGRPTPSGPRSRACQA